jgi:hypothetical protein
VKVSGIEGSNEGVKLLPHSNLLVHLVTKQFMFSINGINGEGARERTMLAYAENNPGYGMSHSRTLPDQERDLMQEP